MKKLLEFLGAVLLFQGTGGLTYELFGWIKWGFIQRLSFFDGYELYASIATIVLAIAVFVAADSAKS
ncbi:hypothetical protein DSC45_33625 [Streptomyces sp. YIM 130001]|uniref:hypothetical protein n=1 Tax=Streptomyces sp. YIM 130001 TaxID=2259644 RepID=UPI000E6503EA|nr:hypothetical protein [Streptomyces sp. YIM 130001]RII08123.1 hypothetical protein DSC45_33625 [Streptomyces sp. YIM 130001]